MNCPIQHIDIQANNSNKQSSALQANSYQSSNSQVAYPTQTEHASLQSKKVTVKRPELLLPGSPESFRQLVRVVIKQLVHPQPDGRGGAQQAPRLLHLPLQDVKAGQVGSHKVILQAGLMCTVEKYICRTEKSVDSNKTEKGQLDQERRTSQ